MSQGAGSDARRTAGLLVPLFALRSGRGWGIGEIGDLPRFARWAAGAGQQLVQLLPIFEVPAEERSPYSGLSAFALDPIYVTLADLEDHVALGGEAALAPAAQAELAALRAATAPEYARVRRLKRLALVRAWSHFRAREWVTDSARAARFRRFRDAERGWLGDYALFRALQEREGSDWTTWPPALAARDAAALAAARTEMADAILHHEWVQWVAAEQWAAARRASSGVRLKGDLPFMVTEQSADVWARPQEFARDAHLGAPPDAFDAAGQDWALPLPRWDEMARGDFAWLRARAARGAALFDAFRIDHVVGFYRVWAVRPGLAGEFRPATEPAQLALGEALLGTLCGAARPAQVIGEDLGAVPDWVRRSLAALGVPGYRVLRWEADGGVFRDPRGWPVGSVATSGTHDTTPLATWWTDELGDDGRRALAAVPLFAGLAGSDATFTPAVHATLLDGLNAAASDLVVLPFEDACGGRVRINTPATVGPQNWSYRLPWTIEQLDAPEGRALAARLSALAARHGR